MNYSTSTSHPIMDETNYTLDKSNDTCSCLAHRDTVKILKKVSDVEIPWKINPLYKYYKIGWLIAFYWGPALFLPISHLWDWVLSGNVAQWWGARCWVSVYPSNFPLLVTSVSYHHAWCTVWSIPYVILNHQYLLFAWPMLETACIFSLLSLPILPNS